LNRLSSRSRDDCEEVIGSRGSSSRSKGGCGGEEVKEEEEENVVVVCVRGGVACAKCPSGAVMLRLGS
jgi:hypothetical protein